MSDKYIQDKLDRGLIDKESLAFMENMVILSNNFIGEVIGRLDPREKEKEDFIGLVLAGPVMISGELIYKLHKMYKIPLDELVQRYVKSLIAAFDLMRVKDKDIGKH